MDFGARLFSDVVIDAGLGGFGWRLNPPESPREVSLKNEAHRQSQDQATRAF